MKFLQGTGNPILCICVCLTRDGNILPLINHFAGAMMKSGNPSLLSQVPLMLQHYRARSMPAALVRLQNGRGEESSPILKKILALDERAWRVEQIRTMFLPRLLKWDDRNSMLSLIGKSDVKKERSNKQQRRRWYEHENVAESGRMGSGNLRGGRIGRCTTYRSVGQVGLGIRRKSLDLVACEHAQLGGYVCGLSVSGEPGHQP